MATQNRVEHLSIITQELTKLPMVKKPDVRRLLDEHLNPREQEELLITMILQGVEALCVIPVKRSLKVKPH